ncbi:MAG: outer membrane protein assembly factor BamC [Candidatus Azotimanducaceae bacterium]
MQKLNKNYLLVPLCVLSLTSCVWFENFDRRDVYLKAEVTPRVTIPDGLEQPEFKDALVIPDVLDSRNISGEPVVVGLPQALSTNFSVEQIVLKKLGDSRWIFLDAPPESVWPKMKLFWEEKNILVQSSDPAIGVMESQWITAMDGTASEKYESIISGDAWAGSLAETQHKFRLKIEAGIRSGSSEVYLEQKEAPLNAPVRSDTANWTGKSDDLDLEDEMLRKLAYYLGENINKSVVSIGATALQNKKTELVPDAVKPVLIYRLAFNRVWATVGDAFKNIGIPVEDLDRESGIYYVNFEENIVDEPSFLARVLFRKKKIVASDQNRYQVQLTTLEDQVQVTVMTDENTPADATLAERLLKIIKESSS